MFLPILIVALQIVLIIHVFYTQRPLWWAAILFMMPGVGSIVYLAVEILPSLGLFRVARQAKATAIATLDPQRDYRTATEALATAPTMGNRLRLAQASEGLAKWEEAEALYRECLIGQFADDPTALLGHARSLIELNRADEAVKQIDLLREQGRQGADVALVYARAAEACGMVAAAEEAYAFASPRIPTLEAQGRYIRFLRRTGREKEADVELIELKFRLSLVPRAFAADARVWLDYAIAESH